MKLYAVTSEQSFTQSHPPCPLVPHSDGASAGAGEDHGRMGRRDYVFGYEAEPADERPTDYGTTDFGQSGLVALSSGHVPWSTTEHSTFEEPSRVGDLVEARREEKKLKQRLTALALLLGTTTAAAVAFLLSRQ